MFSPHIIPYNGGRWIPGLVNQSTGIYGTKRCCMGVILQTVKNDGVWGVDIWGCPPPLFQIVTTKMVLIANIVTKLKN